MTQWTLSAFWGPRGDTVTSYAERLGRFLEGLAGLDPMLRGAWRPQDGSPIDVGDPAALRAYVAESRMVDDVGKASADWRTPQLYLGDWSVPHGDPSPRFAFEGSFIEGRSDGGPLDGGAVKLVAHGAFSDGLADRAEELALLAARAWQPAEARVSDRALSSLQRATGQRIPSVRQGPAWAYSAWYADGALDGSLPGERHGDGVLLTLDRDASAAGRVWTTLAEAGLRRKPLAPQVRLPAIS